MSLSDVIHELETKLAEIEEKLADAALESFFRSREITDLAIGLKNVLGELRALPGLDTPPSIFNLRYTDDDERWAVALQSVRDLYDSLAAARAVHWKRVEARRGP